MGVITISRQMGSLGTLIAGQVAKELGMKCVGKETISTIMREYGFSRYTEIYNEYPGFWERYDNMRFQTLSFLVKTVEALGAHDNVVIVGRGGFEIFNDFADVLNVRMTAPFDVRVKRKKAEHNISLEEAQKRIKENDKVRKAFLETEMGSAYSPAMEFDLVLNTGVVLPDLATDAVVGAYRNLLKFGRNENSKHLKDIKTDSILAGFVEKILSSE
ncbi:MAG: cytidylate kinase-like family protein [Spirochaetia bacterium]|jgi:cytidylate kinase|nr:cytidylate kinase-like family protein [Spirochaetia bacterium]